MPDAPIAALQNIATQLRIDSIRATTAAGSGHPTTCMSAAEIVAALFFAEMRFDPRDPRHPESDRFVLSKGHGAPLLYAAWAAAGAFPRDELLKLRQIGSDLEGHPTPRLPFVDVATGSLGQGLAAGVGMALNARRIGSDYRTYVLLGDGETAEAPCGKRPRSPPRSSSTVCAASPTSTASVRAERPSGGTILGRLRAGIARAAGTPSRLTATSCRPSWRRSPRRKRRAGGRR
jgi:hypothetical protein